MRLFQNDHWVQIDPITLIAYYKKQIFDLYFQKFARIMSLESKIIMHFSTPLSTMETCLEVVQLNNGTINKIIHCKIQLGSTGEKKVI